MVVAEGDGNATRWTGGVVSNKRAHAGRDGRGDRRRGRGQRQRLSSRRWTTSTLCSGSYDDDIRTDRELWSYEPIVEGVQVPVARGWRLRRRRRRRRRAATRDGKVTWYENLGTSMGDASMHDPPHRSPTREERQSCAVGDVDDDGQPDVLSANFEDGAVVWYQGVCRRRNRTWTAGAVVDDVPRRDRVVGADVDGDGDLDPSSPSTGSSLSNAEATDTATDTVTWYDMHLVPFPTASPTIRFKPTDAPLPLPARGSDPPPCPRLWTRFGPRTLGRWCRLACRRKRASAHAP